jgi:acyl carrier protein
LDVIQSLRAPHVVVSTASLDARLAQWTSQASQAASAAPVEARHARPRLASEYVEPRNDTERYVLQIWSQLLGVEQIGVHDDFFELGGHSLLGTRVLARVQETFGVKLPLRALFEAPTGAELAERIQTLVWVSSGGPAGPAVEEMEELQF